jgi:UDP-N-acetylglucosamine 2-epimerase (non-hydrolysing)
MRILTVVGTRPEIIRLSRIIPKLDSVATHTLVHTGQNFSDNLSRVFFEELDVREPDVWMRVDTSSFGRQLATLFEGFERVLDEHRPDRVLILGDTNSALVAFNCKRRGIPVYHMEAGNRCFDERVPEEVNRRVIDHCSAVLMPYTSRSAENLVREGIERHRIFVTGNPIFEVLQAHEHGIDASPALDRHDVRPQQYLLATMHRAENVDDPSVFGELCRALQEVAEIYSMPLIFSVHPRIAERVRQVGFAGTRVRLVEAMPFFEFVRLQKDAALVLSDSGTVQEESAIFRVPVITIRDSTERPETIEAGSNIVASTRPAAIVAAARYLRSVGTVGRWDPPTEYVNPFVSESVVKILLSDVAWAAAGHVRSGQR